MSLTTEFEHMSAVPSPSMSRRVQLRKKLADRQNNKEGEGEEGDYFQFHRKTIANISICVQRCPQANGARMESNSPAPKGIKARGIFGREKRWRLMPIRPVSAPNYQYRQ